MFIHFFLPCLILCLKAIDTKNITKNPVARSVNDGNSGIIASIFGKVTKKQKKPAKLRYVDFFTLLPLLNFFFVLQL